MKYAILDITGLPTAFYDDSIHSAIPDGAIKITETQWKECLDYQGQRAFVSGELGPYTKVKIFSELQSEKLSQLKTNFETKALRPKVPTSLGFDVDGGYNDLQNFTIGKKHSLPQVKDASGDYHNITTADYDKIITAIEDFGIALLQWKWTKEAEINAITVSATMPEDDAIVALEAVVIV